MEKQEDAPSLRAHLDFSDAFQKPPALEPSTPPSLDLLERIGGMYRLLDLRNDGGSGGIVDKIVIDQDSVARFANTVSPGSYRSKTQVDFCSLDEKIIKPLGVYGSIPALVSFLEDLKVIDQEVREILLMSRTQHSGISVPSLRPGIYLLDLNRSEVALRYIIFWPEDSTWEDNSLTSVSRNRVAFMRYMTKLCGQLLCLISDEHSANLVWKDEKQHAVEDRDEQWLTFNDRLYTFTVEQINEEEETAVAQAGFLLPHLSITSATVTPASDPTDELILSSQLAFGDISQAILQVEFKPEEFRTMKFEETAYQRGLMCRLSGFFGHSIGLADGIDIPSLGLLFENGLWDTVGPDLKSQWDARLISEELSRQKDHMDQIDQKLEQIKSEVLMLKKSMPLYLMEAAMERYPVLLEFREQLWTSISTARSDSLQEIDEGPGRAEDVSLWLEQHPAWAKRTGGKVDNAFQTLETLRTDRYVTLKRRLLRVVHTMEDRPSIKDDEIQRLVEEINSDSASGFKAVVKSVTGAIVTGRLGSITSPPTDDVGFAALLENLARTKPVFSDIAQQIKQLLIKHLATKIKELENFPLEIGAAIQKEMARNTGFQFTSREREERDLAWLWLKAQVQHTLAAARPTKDSNLIIENVDMLSDGKFRLRGIFSTIEHACLRYKLHPLAVKSDDVQRITSDRSFVCQPVILSGTPQFFTLPLNTKLRFMRLVGKDSCLMILQTDDFFDIYLDQIHLLRSIVEGNSPKKQIYIEKIGPHCLFALDETKRLLAVLSCPPDSVILHIYTYDEQGKALHARGEALNITRWYTSYVSVPNFSHLVFVAGKEEILLIEDTGNCRIFSLVTQTFRPSNLEVTETILEAFSSPDGTCLLFITKFNDKPQIRCIHWASFGSNQGIELDGLSYIPARSQMAVSSIGHRDACHLLFLDTESKSCRSLLIRMTSRLSDFSVQSDVGGFHTNQTLASAVNNSLIECHAEVWAKFPVDGGVFEKEKSEDAILGVRSILFVSSAVPSKFSRYFNSMINDFEAKMQKPTKGLLKQIEITALRNFPSDSLQETITISELRVGEWLVGMFCMVPIHLAVTNSNRFNPLKDGMSSPQFERSLLGANAIQIAQAISFGWYESIFGSYLASKPVKVVTSMGEQSVGKSFALNHLADTSFAGSAMRCTEGVWLSVTPTRDYVLVAMDFEGFHSIERSAQEDTLLVLLNAAVSNLVLFRNNFAMSRDIAGLFTSFQSSTNLLDTASNDTLFNGTLAIIIKDVIDSDAREIVSEFHQKFQRIVQQEKDENFISKLHKGKLDMIPWPVIESKRFYEMFGALKMRLDRKPVVYKHAGAFVGDLKMLMAKLKANDWGTLDLNLAIQRADRLSTLLFFALAFGTTDPSFGEPLKHYDTDQVIPGEIQKAVFFLESPAKAVDNTFSVPSCLSNLRQSFPGYFYRYQIQEDEFFSRLTNFLHSLVTNRISHVQEWLKLNTERFSTRPEILKLFRDFESLSKELRANVALCGSKCSSCGLLCLENKSHDGGHNCQTSHRCPELCSFAGKHNVLSVDDPPCGMPAGHPGRHLCSDTPHMCDVTCDLYLKDGCLNICSKPMDHDEDDEHLCAANLHACGASCSLVEPDGTALCTRPCVVDCRREHSRHACDRSFSCPIKCQLCNSFCAAGDHFHALEEGAVHLCGQVHACRELCQGGICQVDTTPQSAKSTFYGKHAIYSYTKYTQEAKRLPCIVPIEADQTDHKGRPHQHSLSSLSFHFCDQRCEYCGYYCTLPQRHQQDQHHTSHGSMSHTKWVVEGDGSAALELQGHKYATGDSGAPMLCSMLCKSLERHVHIDRCRTNAEGECLGGDGIQHQSHGSSTGQDWVSHRLFWERSGFKDPYTVVEQAEFDLCDHRCGGEEHDPNVTTGAKPSYCTLPLFHPLADAAKQPVRGYISADGHRYKCKDPAQLQRSYHIFFAIDNSSSMRYKDRRPLPNSPATTRIVAVADNRFGAMASSLYEFWTARAAATGSATGTRRDAYTVVSFGFSATTIIANDTASNPDQLLVPVLSQGAHWIAVTDFTGALQNIQEEMERTWSTKRSPVVVFLSDGESGLHDPTVYKLCRSAVARGAPLALHAVHFGDNKNSKSLRRMVEIAGEVYTTAPRDPLARAGNPCTFSSALDTIQLANTFMTIATSLKNPRAALSRA